MTRAMRWVAIVLAGLVGLAIVGAIAGSGGTTTTREVVRTVTVAAAAGDPSAVQQVVTETVPADPVTETVTRTVQKVVVRKVPVAPPGPSGSIDGTGVFLVGKDIRPGTYRSRPAADSGGSCYWARLKDAKGDLDSILANDNEAGSFVVAIAPTDYAFETSGCETYRRIA